MINSRLYTPEAKASADLKKPFSYRNKELEAATRAGNATILTFSDGGYWAGDNLAAGAWVSYVLGGHWGGQ